MSAHVLPRLAACRFASTRNCLRLNHWFRDRVTARNSTQCVFSSSPLQTRPLHSACILYKTKPTKKQQTISTPRLGGHGTIQLFDQDGLDLGVMSRNRAERIARDDQLKLVQVDRGDQLPHPLYKLLSGKQLADEQMKHRKEKQITKDKPMRQIKISSKISDHDLETKTKQILHWLEKEVEVKVYIKSSIRAHRESPTKPDQGVISVFNRITGITKELAVVKQERNVNADRTFHLKPKDSEPITE